MFPGLLGDVSYTESPDPAPGPQDANDLASWGSGEGDGEEGEGDEGRGASLLTGHTLALTLPGLMDVASPVA